LEIGLLDKDALDDDLDSYNCSTCTVGMDSLCVLYNLNDMGNDNMAVLGFLMLILILILLRFLLCSN